MRPTQLSYSLSVTERPKDESENMLLVLYGPRSGRQGSGFMTLAEARRLRDYLNKSFAAIDGEFRTRMEQAQ